jgi:RecA-family ATPase
MKTNVIPLRPTYSVAEVIEQFGLGASTGREEPGTRIAARKAGGLHLRLPQEMQKVCHDGKRTKTLATLAGKLIAQDRDLDEVIELVRAWNSRNQPPLDDDKVVGTCASLIRTHERNHPDQTEGTDPQPLFSLDEARVSNILSLVPPPRRWLLKDILLLGKVGAVVAPGGTGKSQFLLQLGASIASGLQFLGFWEVVEAGGVLMLMAEDDYEEIHHRLHHIHSVLVAQHPNDLTMTQRITANLFVRSMVGESNLMTAARSDGEVASTGYAQRVVLTAKQIPNLKLVVIDPASRFRGGIENSAEDVTRFIEELEFIKKRTGATVIVAHHTNKGSLNATESNQNAARGSSAFSDGVRWQMNLASLTKKETEELSIAEEKRRFYLTASTVKNNYGPPSDGVLLHRGEGGYLERVEPTSCSSAKQDDLLYRVRQLLRLEGKAGKQYTRSSFEDERGGAKGPLKIGKTALREFLKGAVADNKLWVNEKGMLLADSPMPSGYSALSDKKP